LGSLNFTTLYLSD